MVAEQAEARLDEVEPRPGAALSRCCLRGAR